MLIRLGEEDRKRLGCDEWLEWDSRLLIGEAIALEDAAKISPEEYTALIRGNPQFRDGQPVIDAKGAQVFKHTALTYKVVVWQALYRAGVNVAWGELEFDWRQFETRTEENDGSDDEEDKTPDSD